MKKNTKFSRWLVILVAIALLVALFPLTSQAEGEPAVLTDQADYYPGEIVTLSGFNWYNDSMVHVFVVDSATGIPCADMDVPVDGATGTFSYSFTIHPYYVPNYDVSVLGLDSGAFATTTFTDTARDFKQFENTTPTWIGGALNSQKSAYREGMSVPQRLLLTSVDGTSPHYVNFEYQFTKGGKYAYDFITSWDQSVQAASRIAGQDWYGDWGTDILWIDVKSADKDMLIYYEDAEINVSVKKRTHCSKF